MMARRFAAAILCGMVLAPRAEAETIAYAALDDRSKAAIAETCAGWVIEERPELVAFWMEAIKPLCEAAASVQTQTSAPATAQ